MAKFNYNRKYNLSISILTNINNPAETVTFESPETQEFSKLNEDPDKINLRSEPPKPKIVEITNSVENFNAVEITDLQLEALVNSSSKSSGSELNNAEITIVGLDEETISLITGANRNVILKAGYEGDKELPIIFNGQTVSVTTKREGNEVRTTLVCKDGYTPSGTIRVGLSYNNITYGDLFDKLADIWKKNGINSTNKTIIKDEISPPFKVPPRDILIKNGWSYQGYLRQAMDDVCKSLNYEWFILNSVLYIQPRNFKNIISIAELDNSQIKSLRDQQENTRVSSTNVESTGIAVSTFLDGRFNLASKLKILEGSKKGTYAITQVSHKLNYRGANWDTQLTCEGVS